MVLGMSHFAHAARRAGRGTSRALVVPIPDATALGTFLERSATVAALTVSRDGVATAANACLERLVGPVRSIYDIVAEGQEAVVDELLRVTGPGWSSSRAGLVARAGSIVDCELSALARGPQILLLAEPLHEPADRLNRHLLELNDELLAARRALTDGNRKLRELDDLKNMFIASVTHDLKTPMTSIVGYAELLGEEDLNEAAMGMVGTIVRNAKRLISMIDDLLGAAQVMTGELHLECSSVDVVDALRQAADAIQPSAVAAGVTATMSASAALRLRRQPLSMILLDEH